MSAKSDVEQAILEVKEHLGADSCTFYVRDPYWTDDLRLLFMPGVTVPEPMHGFLMPTVSRARIIDGELVSLNRQDPSQPTAVSRTLADLIAQKPLFGDFQVREQVRSYVKLVFKDESLGPIGSLFLNFKRDVAEDTYAGWEKQLSKLYETIEKALSDTMRELDGEDPLPIRRLLQILSTVTQLLSVGGPGTDPIATQQKYLDGLLDTVLEAYGIGAGGGFGSIHLYDPSTETLELRASRPAGIQFQKTQSCKDGQGVISWVALRGRPILILDLKESNFQRQKVYVRVRDGIRQEIAIPMMIDGKVVGVLNIESTEDSFKPEDVRVLWYAADQAAVAFRLGRQLTEYNTLATRIRTLLDLCGESVTKGPPVDPRKPDERLNRLAKLLAQWNGATMCDIWGYAKATDEFWGVGASSDQIDLDLAPRKLEEGFSRLVISKKSTILINQIKAPSEFEALVWTTTDGAGRWEPLAGAPGSVSPGLKNLPVRAEIGIPMTGRDGVIGIAWLKYEKPFSRLPTAEEMKNIEGLAASVALNLELLYEYDRFVKSSDSGVKERLRRLHRDLMPPFPRIRGLDVHVQSRPFEDAIGGDFHGWYLRELDDKDDSKRDRIAIILGDAAGHGIEGALKMLPLYTSYRALRVRTTSTHYVLEKMSEIAKDLDADGTALYFILDSPQKGSTEWTISASIAGDAPPLMIFKDRANKHLWPDNPEQAHTRFIAPLAPPLGEAVMKCGAGTIIVAVTDGIIDAGTKDVGKSAFGHEGVSLAVQQAVFKNRNIPAEGIADAIFRMAVEHGTIHDDATVLVVKLADPSQARVGPVSTCGAGPSPERHEQKETGG